MVLCDKQQFSQTLLWAVLNNFRRLKTFEAMTPPNFCNFRKIAKQLFIVLFVINQLIVFHYLWVSYVNDSPLNFIQSIARDATTTTKLPTTTKSPPPTPAPRFKMLYDEVKPKNESIKHVLFFNGCFGKPFWRLGKENSTAEDLKLASCPHTNCIFTHKKDYLQNIHDYDAIIFNVWYGDSDLPKTRTPSQHYILAANEWVLKISFSSYYFHFRFPQGAMSSWPKFRQGIKHFQLNNDLSTSFRHCLVLWWSYRLRNWSGCRARHLCAVAESRRTFWRLKY